MPRLAWTDGYLIFAVMIPLLALDGLQVLREWLGDREREGRLGPASARVLQGLRLLPVSRPRP